MLKQKSITALAALIGITGLLAGCGTSQTNGTSTANQPTGVQTANNEKVKLTYFSWDPANEKLNRDLIAQFTKQNPNIEIDMQAYEPATYWTKISALAASGSTPDVMDMSSGYVDEWAGKGLLYDMQKLVDRDIKSNDYYTSLYTAVRYPDKQKGDMYAFPINYVTTVLYYNKDLFDKAGVSYPTEKWTWDDFLNAAKKLTVDTNGDGKPDQWGFFTYGRYAQIEPWIYQNNGDILNADKTKFEVNDNAKEALQFLTDLTLKYKVSPSPKSVGDQKGTMFQTGKAAMLVEGSFAIDGFRKDVGDKFKWGMTTIPHGPHSTKEVTYGWPDNMAIAKSSKNVEAAWKFIQFMSGPSRPVEQFPGGKVPAYKPTAMSDAWLEKGKLPDNKGLILKQGESIGPNSYTKSWSEWRGYAAAVGSGMNGELDQVFDGVKPFDAALQSMTKYANDILSRK
ncbi:sugar ABC transporter substrate-binding protein [Paenibacillus filicis]|uniref:Sugar ABC transporter substrate-binding protein n=1 Tax=Paenibacillus gyeongsangnamensis TaxID=3388067 RepID=A0ABT4QGT5_9BACL|nr:sugar ABC transporter substrate-binding protein [Paenibacillus filicis]MCZ8516059.1 sugar ABC transporter substrate-binding protein [Paenibacillus filicis]